MGMSYKWPWEFGWWVGSDHRGKLDIEPHEMW